MRSWAVAVTIVAATFGGACDGSSDPALSRDARVYVATVRSVVAELDPPSDPDVLPVVYVLSSGEKDIAATVQADVAEKLADVAEVRFADTREEAVDEEDPGAPVHDDGILVAVGPVEGGDDGPVDMTVEVYRSDVEWSRRLVTFGRDGDEWTPTSTSVVDEQDRSVPNATADVDGDGEGGAPATVPLTDPPTGSSTAPLPEPTAAPASDPTTAPATGPTSGPTTAP